MKTCRATVLLLLALVFSLQASPLRDQLALAKGADDTHSQIELIRRILDQEPHDADLHEELCDLWVSIADYDMAEQTVKEWKDAPEFVTASIMASVLYNRDDKKEEAVKLLADYHAKAPDDLEITRQLAKDLAAMNEDQKVVDLLDGAPGVPADADLLVDRAIARRNVQDFDGALNDFALADKVTTDDPAVTSNRASFDRLQAALGGIKESTVALAKDPNNIPALLSRAYWYYSTGFAGEQARNDANAARRLNPDAVATLLLYANAAKSTGKLTSADALKKFSIDLNKSLPSLEDLMHIYQCDVQIKAKPKDPSGYCLRALLLNDAPQQYFLANNDTTTALALDPANPNALMQKIFALVKLGNYDAATAEFQLLEKAKLTPVQFAKAASYLTDVAFAASKFDLALDYANRAIKATPNVAQYYKQRAAVLQKLSRPTEAEADLARATALEKKGKP